MDKVRIIFCFLLLIVTCSSKSSHKTHTVNKEADTGYFSKSKEFIKELVGIVFDRVLSLSFLPGVDVARVLVNSFDTEAMTSDLTAAREAMHGLEFDEYDENHGNRVLKGIRLDEFENVVRVIAASNDLPDKFVDEILLGKLMETNESQRKEFVFNLGKKVTFGIV